MSVTTVSALVAADGIFCEGYRQVEVPVAAVGVCFHGTTVCSVCVAGWRDYLFLERFPWG